MGSQAPTLRANVRTPKKALWGNAYPEVLQLFRPGATPRVRYAKLLAQTAVFAYLVGLAVDLNVNVLLLFLAASSIAAVVLGEERLPSRSPVVVLVAVFLSVAVLSIGISEAVSRSLRLSAPLLPAVLLFFLIYTYFTDAKDLRNLYLCLSLVALGLAVALLWTALTASIRDPTAWIPELGSPILIVPNDVTFLAVIAPLGLALAYDRPRSVVGALALLSVALSGCVAAVYGSRGATLTFLVSTACTAAALRLHRYLVALGIACAGLLAVAYLLDLPLLSKFSHLTSDGRLSHWATAWALFLEAPLLGHGLHTFIDTSLHSQGVAWAHSLYLQTLAEQGIFGLLALLLLLSYATLAAWKATRSPVREQRILAAGALGALVGFCAASTVELTLVREWVVLVMFVLFALAARIPSAKMGAVTKEG